MSVRWKPMILLTAVFVVLAGLGLFAFTRVLFPSRAEDLLPLARADAEAGKFDRADIQYRRALQRAPKNPTIHLEHARMLAKWVDAQPELKAKIRLNWLAALTNAAKHGPQLAEPRELLLAEALASDEWGDCVHWARELEPIQPANRDARFVLAAESLETEPPDLAHARDLMRPLEEAEPARHRTLWLRARFAQRAGDEATLKEVLATARTTDRGARAEDRLAEARLRALDVAQATEPDSLAERVAAFRAAASELAAGDVTPARAREITEMLQRVQNHLRKTTTAHPAQRDQLDPLDAALVELAEAIYVRASEFSQGHDLRPHQSYAEYLLARGERDRCMEVVAAALATPAQTQAFWIPTAMELREIGIKAALLDSNDAKRYERANLWIKDLLASGNPRYRALGHLFSGVIELEQAGLGAAAETPPTQTGESTRSALAHLKESAAELKDVPTAQALYGVGLLLGGEPVLGRQYLQAALRAAGGRLDPRYQVWAALASMQAGYPEDAHPIIEGLLAATESNAPTPELAATLHMLKAEIHQARQTAADIKIAQAEYQKAFALGLPKSPALELRIAQLAAMAGNDAAALQTLEALGNDQENGAAAQRAAAIALHQQGKTAEAIARVDSALAKFKDNAELAELAAALRIQADRPADAETLLAQFTAAHPENENLVLMRAKILSEALQRHDEARALVNTLCESGHTSSPWILRAHIELAAKNQSAAAETIQQIRNRWPEAAAADLLDAQLALSEGDMPKANAHLDAAIAKDPSNKVALFWKGRLDELTGSPAQAQAIFEQLARQRPLKEIDGGLSLGTAAQWALASMALQRQQFDAAVSGYESILREAPNQEVARSARWNLALARAAKGQVAEAKADVAALLRDPNTTAEERVQAADFLRRHGDEPAAVAQIDLVLKNQPAHPGAVTYKSLLLLDKNRREDAGKLVRAAIAAGNAPPGLYLLLAAIENQAGADGLPRAKLALDEGIKAHQDNTELLRARYQIMTLMNDPAALTQLEQTHAQTQNPNGPAADVLVEAYRERGNLEQAIDLIAKRRAAAPERSALARSLTVQHIGLLAARAGQARAAADQPAERRALDQATAILTAARAAEPAHLPYLEAEGELALQAGDLARAQSIADELAKLDRSAVTGPLLMARVAAAQRNTPEITRAYEAAVERSPGRSDLRLALARAQMDMGRYDDAVRQASTVLQTERNLPAAQFIKAQALARAEGTPQEVKRQRAEAATILRGIISATPSYISAYGLLSDLLVLEGKRPEAIALLKTGLQQAPKDEGTLSLLLQRLCEPAETGKPANPNSLADADQIARAAAANDAGGSVLLAIALGFHHAGQNERALPWVEQALERLDDPAAHLTAGDILLACAEADESSAQARAWFTQAVTQYDQALAKRPDLIEAINNKAWILHRHLGRNDEAAKLVQNVVNRQGADGLPPDFLDTIGAIMEAAGKPGEAEAYYMRGLRQAPAHPILNFHLGRLLKTSGQNDTRAQEYLKRAAAGRQILPNDMAAELDRLLASIAP